MILSPNRSGRHCLRQRGRITIDRTFRSVSAHPGSSAPPRADPCGRRDGGVPSRRPGPARVRAGGAARVRAAFARARISDSLCTVSRATPPGFRLQPLDYSCVRSAAAPHETRLEVQQFSEHQIDGVIVVAATGAVDMLTAPQLQDVVSAALERKPGALIIDLTEVDFLGSAGMQVLMITRKELDGAIRFAVVADGPATSRPLKITGVADYIDLFSTLDVALQNLKA
ncbi:STAS domain-containing protein [Mycolicibacterium vaccae]|nr:STAS domain-containing protein [Mycolicibacterium vaccae]